MVEKNAYGEASGGVAEAPAAGEGASARPAKRTARPLARKVLSVALSVMLVLTMSPFANSGAAIATGTEGLGGGRLKAYSTPL